MPVCPKKPGASVCWDTGQRPLPLPRWGYLPATDARLTYGPFPRRVTKCMSRWDDCSVSEGVTLALSGAACPLPLERFVRRSLCKLGSEYKGLHRKTLSLSQAVFGGSDAQIQNDGCELFPAFARLLAGLPSRSRNKPAARCQPGPRSLWRVG